MKNEDSELTDAALWLVIIITLVGGFLRFLLLDSKGLWLDETFSIWISSHNVADMLSWIARVDQHPPLYYLLLHYWIAQFGNTAYYVRMFSVLFSAATIPVIYLIGKRLSGVVMGLVAAVFFAISPFNIAYAQETRMYSLLTFNAAVAIYALAILLTDPRSIRPIGSQLREYMHAWRAGNQVDPDPEKYLSYLNETRNQKGFRAWISRYLGALIHTIGTDLVWIVFIVFSAATMLSHNTALLFPFATNIFVLGLMIYQWKKKSETLPAFHAPSFWNWVIAQIGIFLLWCPWLIVFIRQASRVYQEFWLPKPDWATIVHTLQFFLNASGPDVAKELTIIWSLYALMICLGLVYFRKNISIFLFLAVLFLVPFLGELIISIRRPIFMDRTLIWTTIPLFLLLAAGIVQLRYRLLMILVLVVLATINLFSTSDYFRFFQKEDWSYPAGYVAKFIQNDDLILFNSSLAQIPFDYYFKSFEDQYSIQVEKHGVPGDVFANDLTEPRMTVNDVPKLVAMLKGHEKVYLVYSHNSYTDPMGLIPQTLAAQLKLVEKRDFYGVEVEKFETP